MKEKDLPELNINAPMPKCKPPKELCSIKYCTDVAIGKRIITWPDASEDLEMDLHLCEKHWKILHKSEKGKE